MIERYVQSIGLTKEATFDEASNTWQWQRGSAPIEVFLADGGNNRYYICIYANIMQVPANANQADFYRYLLELNFDKLGMRLCIKPKSSWIFAFYERDVKGMDYEELTTCIKDLEWWADKLDDELKGKFQ